MNNHQLNFHGYVEMKKETPLYIVKYSLEKREPRVLPYSRWCQFSPVFRWGVIDEGCQQLSWTMLFAYLLKQMKMPDKKATAELVHENLVYSFSRKHIERMPASWSMSGLVIAKFLLNSTKNTNSKTSISPFLYEILFKQYQIQIKEK